MTEWEGPTALLFAGLYHKEIIFPSGSLFSSPEKQKVSPMCMVTVKMPCSGSTRLALQPPVPLHRYYWRRDLNPRVPNSWAVLDTQTQHFCACVSSTVKWTVLASVGQRPGYGQGPERSQQGGHCPSSCRSKERHKAIISTTRARGWDCSAFRRGGSQELNGEKGTTGG